MAYTNYENLKQVTDEFGLKVKRIHFLKTKPFKVNEYYLEVLKRYFADGSSIASEIAICEKLISPIINEVAYANKLTVFSHVVFNLKGSESLKGIPDYLIGIKANDDTTLGTPIVCLGEAKKDNFVLGWGQVAAEMYAAQQANKEENLNIPIYGLVSNGRLWEIGLLTGNNLQIDTISYSGQSQEIFDVLNWVFADCYKNLSEVINLEED